MMDKLMLWGAWALMAVVGALSAWKVSQTPKVEPWIAAAEKALNPKVRVMDPPPAIPAWNNPWDKTLPVARAIRPGGDVVLPRLMYVDGPPHPLMDVFVLPYPVVAEAKPDLNGTTLTWTLQNPPQEKLASWMTQKPAKPEGFLIQRQCGDEKAETLAKVGPEVKTFTDLSTEPRKTYRYWVLVTGKETNRTAYPPVQEPVTKGLPEAATAKTPSATRVKLVGGDKDQAVLRVETYDRTQKKWIAKTIVVAPGRDVGTSGWILNGLKFDKFTLVADLTDDEGVERVQTTK